MHSYEMILEAVRNAAENCTDSKGRFDKRKAITIAKDLYEKIFLENNSAQEKAQEWIIPDCYVGSAVLYCCIKDKQCPIATSCERRTDAINSANAISPRCHR
jgi:hypothetical protein